MRKIIVAHPGQQHSYYSAIALYEELVEYITTLYYRPLKSWTWLASKLLPAEVRKRAENRKNDFIEKKVHTKYELLSLISMTGIQNKLPILRKVTDFYDKFGAYVAKEAIKKKCDAVIMYDTTAEECFRELINSGKHIVKILDATIGSRLYTRQIYEKEMQDYCFDGLRKEFPNLWNPVLNSRVKSEIDLADYAIVGSEYVKKTLVFSGMKENQIFIVPYGSDIRLEQSEKKYRVGERLELLFVGQVNYRKGIHRLMDAINMFNSNQVHLTVVGQFDPNSELYRKNKDNPRVTFKGFWPYGEMGRIYADSHVFVLPSLSEGMARVGIEALGCGLPVICSENSGVNDIITDGLNGFVIKTGNTEQIIEKIAYFLCNPVEVERMSLAALATGAKYTWERYCDEYKKTVDLILDEEFCGEQFLSQ